MSNDTTEMGLPEDITELSAIQADFRDLAAILNEQFDDASVAELAEVGSLLASIIKRAGAVQDKIKIRLREQALTDLSNAPGTITFEGESPNTAVSVTVPKPRVVLSKDADMELVQKVLGQDFDLYFETVVAHKPRPTTPDLIVSLPDGTTKTILLSTVEEKQGTPRVSFKV